MNKFLFVLILGILSFNIIHPVEAAPCTGGNCTSNTTITVTDQSAVCASIQNGIASFGSQFPTFMVMAGILVTVTLASLMIGAVVFFKDGGGMNFGGASSAFIFPFIIFIILMGLTLLIGGISIASICELL